MTTTNHNHNSNPLPKNYHDRILRPEYQRMRRRFPYGRTWLRILSPSGTSDGWCLPILSQEFPGGRFVHPATFHPGQRSAFDVAHDWFRRHAPDQLRSKTNKTGFRLRPVRVCAFWAIEYSETGNHRLRLVLESFNDGVKGPAGLAHEIQRKITEKDENDQPMCDALDPENGVMVCVERSKRQFSQAPLDWVRVGRIPHPVDELLENVSPKEKYLLRPLEQLIHDPSEEEEWTYLGRLISPGLAARIRAYTQRRRK